MENQKTQNNCKKYFVIQVALKRRGRYRFFVADPEIFFATQEEAQEVKNKLIKNQKYKSNQLQIKEVWRVKS